MHLSLLFILIVPANCFTFSRFDNFLENEGLVRVRRDTKTPDSSSSSEEGHLSTDATVGPSALKKVNAGPSETDEEVKLKIAIPLEGSGAENVETRPVRGVEGSGLESADIIRVLRDDASDLFEEEGSGRLGRDVAEGSGFDMARFADLPLESSGNEDSGLRAPRSEGSGSDEDARITREAAEEGSGAESDFVGVESSGNSGRISRDIEGSGETVISAPVRFIREGSGALAE